MRRLVLVLGLCGALAPTAGARPLHATVIGHATRVIGSDGSRFAAWQDGDVALTYVYDARTGKIVRASPPAGCAVTAIGAGALVATCDAYPLLSSAQVLDLRTGVWRQAVAAGEDAPGFGFTRSRTFVGIGTRWIQARLSDYHLSSSAFFARADGSAYAGRPPFGAHVQPDLDAVGLRRPLCWPLRAVSQEPDSDSNDGWYPLQIAGSFSIAAHGVPSNVVEQRCGQRRQRTLCRRWCFTPTLVGAHVAWADDRGIVHVRGVRSGRTTSYGSGTHPVAGLYPAGSRVVLATDQVAGTERFLVRSAATRALGIR